MRAPMMLPPRRTGIPGLLPVEFNEQSKARLAQVNPTLAELMRLVEAQHPDAFEITEGMRGAQRQAQMVAEGKSQTMNSRHLAGNAVDIALIGPDGQPNWNFEDYRPIAATAKAAAASLGIPDFVWGGDWKTLRDGVHFQVGGPGGGQGGDNVTRSSKGTTGMGLLDMPAQQPQTFGQKIGEGLRSGSLMDSLALAFNSLRMNPDQNLAAMVGQRQEQRGQEKATNRTAQWLSSIGRDDLAQAMLAGSLDPQSAAAIAMTPAAGPERGVVVGGNVVDPVTGQIIYQGPAQSTEPLAPAAFVAMDLQAKAAGFEPGTPQYQEFMATRGAGMAAEARAIGEQRGAAIAGAPIDVATADTTLQLIESVRQDPGLDIGTGLTSAANIIPGTPGYDFQNRVDQLLSGGFLTAIDQLRGMGALSNAEGQTATRAISRMDTATSKTAFLEALSDYENVVRMGRERAAARIPQPATPAGGAPAAGAPSDDDLLNMYGG